MDKKVTTPEVGEVGRMGEPSAQQTTARLGQAPLVSSGAFRLGYRPSLDGLRGVSILVVVVAHAHLIGGRASGIAVTMFFVLSGFLITCLLVEEWEKAASINLKNFYGRRILRLFPALLTMLALMVAYHWIFGSRKVAARVTKDALVAFFYAKNWVVASTYRFDLFSHTWSR
jgi:peptidoglycan/LPS O-acetylase OafA/YrhL